MTQQQQYYNFKLQDAELSVNKQRVCVLEEKRKHKSNDLNTKNIKSDLKKNIDYLCTWLDALKDELSISKKETKILSKRKNQ